MRLVCRTRCESVDDDTLARTDKVLAMRYVVIAVLILILAALGSALYFMMSDRSGTSRSVNALTVRVALSVLLFLFLIAGRHWGWLPAQL